MKRLPIAVIVLLAYGLAYAAPPVPKIQGPTKARTGDLIVLDASESTADHFGWLIDTSGVSIPDDGAEKAKALAERLRSMGFKVEPPKENGSTTHLVLDGGKRVLLASYPGTWRVSLAVGNSEGVKQLPWSLVVAGATPTPPDPGPGPGPGPGPSPPDPDVPTSEIGKAMYAAAQDSKSTTRKTDAATMVAALEKFRPTIAGKTNVTPTEVITGSITSLRVSLDDAAWKGWAVAIATHMSGPLFNNVVDKTSGLAAIDEMIAALRTFSRSRR